MAQHSAKGHGAAGDHDVHGGGHTHGSFKSYTIGFLLSIVLTIIPLVVVLNGMLERTGTIIVLLVTAVLQFIVQLLFFMHLNEEEKPRYNLMTLILGLVIVLTIVLASMWIMAYNGVAH
ncbi:cytochrome o ubiquinol oxidase subunit IV [Paenibacillus tarimensis]|uniref:cytochrome o ubiquinol oxidase subunit IV n=1 Tax=Paenibacillus tarimensis TaxID=416012 RepID=UPI001F255469|nr:cytochrome o ubiquinol oxidase subunit IV [Paenibacillus tarimensis]MCF2943400.1 cytochrome o ubiquinol oxidase subunit IV [Paenibacillus tarimensis]